MSPERCRLAASAIAPVSYIALVSGLVSIGASLNLVGQILIVPFALKHRAWDLIALSVFFTAVNLVALAPGNVLPFQQEPGSLNSVNLSEEPK